MVPLHSQQKEVHSESSIPSSFLFFINTVAGDKQYVALRVSWLCMLFGDHWSLYKFRLAGSCVPSGMSDSRYLTKEFRTEITEMYFYVLTESEK